MRSTRDPRADGLAQRVAWLNPRSTQSDPAKVSPSSRGGVASSRNQRSAPDLEAALARRGAWLGNPSPAPDSSSAASDDPLGGEGALLSTLEQSQGPPAANVGPPVVLSPAERRQQALIADALTARGIRYRWGGTSRGGFDCSGFTRYLMARNLGIKLPHSASAQARYGKKVALGELQEGDLVFFRTYRRGISHVGVYVGDNRFIHSPRTGRSVAVEPLTGYYRRRYVTARRLASSGPPSRTLAAKRLNLAAAVAAAEPAK